MLFSKLCYDCEVMIFEYDGGKRDAFDAVLQDERFMKQRALMAFTGKECSHALTGNKWFDYMSDSIYGFNVLTIDEAANELLREEGCPPCVVWLDPTTIYASLKASYKELITLEDIEDMCDFSEELNVIELDELNAMIMQWIDRSLLCEFVLNNFQDICDFERSILFDYDFVEMTEYKGECYLVVTNQS